VFADSIQHIDERDAEAAGMMADSEHPSAVTRVISGEPLAISTIRSPSVTRSTAPVAATMQSRLPASRIARSRAASTPCALSTPFGVAASALRPAIRATLMISEALPRMIVGRCRSNSLTVSSRNRVAPTPTGSSTQGLPSLFAAAAAASMPTTQSADSVPMLTTSALASATNSSTSSGACTIAGDAPIASSAFAATSIET